MVDMRWKVWEENIDGELKEFRILEYKEFLFNEYGQEVVIQDWTEVDDYRIF